MKFVAKGSVTAVTARALLIVAAAIAACEPAPVTDVGQAGGGGR
jgi:hypothetical protein